MQIVDTTTMSWDIISPNPRGGDVWRKHIRGTEGDSGKRMSYDIRFEKFGAGDRVYTSIRHRHDFEQLRFALAGKMDLGFATLEEGDVGYFPANAYYGPQRCEDSYIMIAQWRERFVARAEHDKAVEELKKVGEFVDGVYRTVDAQGQPCEKDPVNAIWEQVTGEPYVAKIPRYRQPILMTPSAFAWSNGTGPVRMRELGTFAENGLTLEFLQWTEDGALEIEADDEDDRPVFLFTTAGSFSHDGSTFGPETGIWIESGESAKVEGSAESESLLVRFPSSN